MGSFGRKASAIGAAILGGTALMTAPPAAQAQVTKQIVNVPCSSPALASAITAANTTPAILRLAAFCTYNITTASVPGVNALPTVTGSMTLLGGPSTTIRRDPAAGAARLLQVSTTGSLRVEGIFVLNGALGVGSGGGIQNAGSLHLVNVTLSGNSTTAGNGGGVENLSTGRARIFRTIISGNTAGGISSGGGIDNAGQLTLDESRVSANNATSNLATGGGGGLSTQTGSTSTIVQSTFDHNTTAGNGGAIFNQGTTSLLRTLVELNTAAISGGGIFNLAPGTVTLSVSIVRFNTPNNCFPLNTIAGCVN
jgi:predicted outer membrane repeat protein